MAEKIFIWAGLIILPFIFSKHGEMARVPKGNAIVVLMALYLGWQFCRHRVYALGCAITIPALWGFSRSWAFHYDNLLVFYAAVASALFFYPAREDLHKHFLKALEVAGLLVVAYVLLQMQGKDKLVYFVNWSEGAMRPTGLFGQHTLYGPFAAACFAVSLFAGHLVPSLIFLTIIFMIGASFTYLSLGAVLFTWLFRLAPKRTILGSIMTAILFFAVFGAPGEIALYRNREWLNDKGRFALWSQIWEFSKNRPWLGYGEGMFPLVYQTFQYRELRQQLGITDEGMSDKAKAMMKEAERIRSFNGLATHVHNEYLEVLFSFGLVGVLFMLWLIYAFFDSFRQWTEKPWVLMAIFLAFLANSLGSFPFHLVPQSLLPLWCFAIVTGRHPPVTIERWSQTSYSALKKWLLTWARSLARLLPRA